LGGCVELDGQGDFQVSGELGVLALFALIDGVP